MPDPSLASLDLRLRPRFGAIFAFGADFAMGAESIRNVAAVVAAASLASIVKGVVAGILNKVRPKRPKPTLKDLQNRCGSRSPVLCEYQVTSQ